MDCAIRISWGSTVFSAFSVNLTAKGVLPSVIANIAAFTPILVPIKKRVTGAIATIKIIIGNERVISVILSNMAWNAGCGDSPLLSVITRIMPNITPKITESTKEVVTITNVSPIAGMIAVGK